MLLFVSVWLIEIVTLNSTITNVLSRSNRIFCSPHS